MYKLLIVDDEQPIREGIANSIPWADLGYEVVGMCRNGLEALEFVRQNAPDVVLSDIMMPKMDGVELMQALNSEFPHVKIIILSGYSDFEYLNMSIKNNVAEYLLKPTDVDEFHALFTRMRAQLDEERLAQLEYQRLREDSEKTREYELIQTLNLLLKGYAEDRQLPGELPGIHIENCVALLLTPDGRLGDDEKTLFHLKTQICEVASRHLTYLQGRFFLSFEESVTGLLGLPASANISMEQLAAALKDLQKAIHSTLSVTVSIGVSELCTEADMLAHCYQQAKCCAQQNVFLGPESLFFYSQFHTEEDQAVEALDIEILKSAVLAGDLDAAGAELWRVLAPFDKRSRKDHQLVDHLCLEALFSLARWALAYNVRFQSVLSGLGASYSDIYRCDSLEKKHHFMAALLFALHREIKSAGPGHRRNSVAYLAKRCVDEEFGNNSFSLEFVAARVGKTPAHISKVFKNELGMNFSEYLLKKRMDYAASLLRDPTVKVYEVATQVGYADTSNFIKVFKKQYGVSPNDYRLGCDGGLLA